MRKIVLLPVLGGLLWLAGCSSEDPLERLRQELDRYPEYSIILEDMDMQGTFFQDYHHRYKIVRGEAQEGSEDLVYRDEIRDWTKVSREFYEKYSNYLGMAISTKSKDGGVDTSGQPPGYQYVGNQRYGQWRTDSGGRSFWAFYGQYAFFTHVFGSFNRPFYRNDWNTYRQSRGRGQPYFGSNNQFGTNGEYTKNSHRNFFTRRQARQQAAQSRFSQKVRSRVNRSSSSGSRSRSGGRGGK